MAPLFRRPRSGTSSRPIVVQDTPPTLPPPVTFVQPTPTPLPCGFLGIVVPEVDQCSLGLGNRVGGSLSKLRPGVSGHLRGWAQGLQSQSFGSQDEQSRCLQGRTCTRFSLSMNTGPGAVPTTSRLRSCLPRSQKQRHFPHGPRTESFKSVSLWLCLLRYLLLARVLSPHVKLLKDSLSLNLQISKLNVRVTNQPKGRRQCASGQRLEVPGGGSICSQLVKWWDNEALFRTVTSAACGYLSPDAAAAAAPRCPLRPALRSTGSRG